MEHLQNNINCNIDNIRFNFLIINQHGENRGDESAKRGMIFGLSKYFQNSSFIMICQFRDRKLTIDFDENVQIISMLIPLQELPGLLVYTAFKIIGFDTRFLLGRNSAQIIKAYENADIVLSAPGGPYFGDIYRGFLSLHELAHWYMVFLGKLFKKPVLLYAPSAGPFKHPIMNILRKQFYKLIDLITTRDDISHGYLKSLLPEREIYLTADATLQRPVKPGNRSTFFGNRYDIFKDHFIVAVSVNDYKYPLSENPEDCKLKYQDCLIQIMIHLHKRKNAHFLMFPQLYGAYHTDVDFLEKLGNLLPAHVSWEIVDPDFSSDKQQELFGICDFCLASRYHPQVFAAIHSLPFIAICYEHKQFGLMKSLGMEAFAFDIYHLHFYHISKSIDEALTNSVNISESINTHILQLINRSAFTSELIYNFIISK